MLYRFGTKRPNVGENSYVSELARVIGDVTIGDNCYIGHGAILRGDYGRIVVGDGTAVEEGVVVHAPPNDCCHIGPRVTIGHGAIIHSKNIGEGSVIGMGAILSIRSEVGEWSIVAEGCVVKRMQSIPSGMVVAGNPAKPVRKVTDEDREFWTWGKKLYSDLALEYLEVGMEPVD